jgi:pyruvate ferredoxin oxidoreductase gamma subunit
VARSYGGPVPSETAFAKRETLEIRLHGRGGQGTVTMAALLVDAAFRNGWHAMGFPSFGSERTGAPVAAFVRLSRAPIVDRSEVRHPDVVVVQDPTLDGAVDLLDGLTPGGIVVINAAESPEDLRGVASVTAVPVTELAIRHLGAPITSTGMLGAFAAVTGIVDIEAVAGAIRSRFNGPTGDRNEAVARAAFAAAVVGSCVAA